MEKWIKKKVNELCILGRGRVISLDEIAENPGTYSVYSSQSKNMGEIGKINTYDFNGEYVTWTTDGAYAGSVFYRNGKFNCTNVCGTLKNKNNLLDMKFLAYLLSTIAKKYVSYIGNPKLMNNIMANIYLNLPEKIDEQKKISEIISKIDQSIEQTEKIIEKYKRIKFGLMQELLSKGIDENWDIRSEETHEFIDTELGKFPEEWIIISMENITIKIIDGIHKKPNYVDYGIPFITVENLTENSSINFERTKYISKKDHEIFSKRILPQEGDVLVTKDGTLGIARLVLSDFPEFSIFVSVALLRPKKEIVLSSFIKIFFESFHFFRQLGKLSAGSGLRHIHLEHFKAFQVPIPPINEQEKIMHILTCFDNYIQSENNQLRKLLKIKKGLMQDLLTGKVKVDNLIEK